MGFINFDVIVQKGDGDSYRIKSKYELGGESPVEIQPGPPDLSSAAYQQFLAYLSGGSNELEYQAAKAAGEVLHRWLFTGEVWVSLIESLKDAASQGKGIRLRLILEEESLRQLPWEYCYDARRYNKFLALDRRSPIVRYIDFPIIPDSLHRDKAARLLLACSVDPADNEAIETAEAELEAIQEELADIVRQKLVVIEMAGQVNLDQLQQQLAVFEPDMLHLVAASQAGDRPKLILFDKAGQPDPKSANQIKALLRATARAVILSAPPSQVAGNDAGLALAEALIQAEVPAVIALHREMPATVAGRFAAQFYRFLALGEPLDAAVTQMRINIQAYDEIAWGIPAMFMRAEDGRLWQEHTPAKPPAPGQPGGHHPPPQQPPDPYSPFMQLNFNNQIKGFNAFLSRQRIGGCLVRSQPQISTESGINLLLKRLFTLIPKAGESPHRFEFNLASLVLDNGPDELWERLAQKLKLYHLVRPFGRRKQEAVTNELGSQLARRHIIFIFKHVDADTVDTLMTQFWEPLVKIILDPELPLLPEGRFLLLAFFLDNKGSVLPQSGAKFIEIKAGEEGEAAQPEGGWKTDQVGASFALPAVSDFTAAELEKWFSMKAAEPLRTHFTDQALDAVQTTMTRTANGRPDFVLNYLVDVLELEQPVSFETWLNHW